MKYRGSEYYGGFKKIKPYNKLDSNTVIFCDKCGIETLHEFIEIFENKWERRDGVGTADDYYNQVKTQQKHYCKHCYENLQS